LSVTGPLAGGERRSVACAAEMPAERRRSRAYQDLKRS
jgi:hypothetical protein